MKNEFLDICFIAILVIIIIAVIMHIYNRNLEGDQSVLEEMTQTMPQKEEQEEIENKVQEIEEKQITSDCEINGNTYEVVAIVNIPTLEIEYPVLSSTSKELLKVSLNKYWGPNPNKKGNFCIVGHNYNDDRFFGKLHKIQNGDKIQLTDMSGKTIDYYVYNTFIADPEDTSCTSQKTEERIEITLITCTKNFKQRFIVKARANK